MLNRRFLRGAKPASGISRNEVTHMPLRGFSLPAFFSPGKESMAMIAIVVVSKAGFFLQFSAIFASEAL